MYFFFPSVVQEYSGCWAVQPEKWKLLRTLVPASKEGQLIRKEEMKPALGLRTRPPIPLLAWGIGKGFMDVYLACRHATDFSCINE